MEAWPVIRLRSHLHDAVDGAPVARRPRRGMSLVEVIVALALLVTVVLGMAMMSTKAGTGVSETGARSRAQAMADQQIALARAWSNYPTLSDLEDPAFNAESEGLTPTTTVVADTSGGVRITTVTVSVAGGPGTGLLQPVVRRITIAAP